MTPSQCATEFESKLHVDPAVGFTEQTEAGPRVDMDYAPNGSPYVTITSGGAVEPSRPLPEWFTDADEAAARWLDQAKLYAEQRGGRDLFWRERPELLTVEFVAVDQTAALNDARLRGSMMIKLCCVVARLAVSKGEAE